MKKKTYFSLDIANYLVLKLFCLISLFFSQNVHVFNLLDT